MLKCDKVYQHRKTELRPIDGRVAAPHLGKVLVDVVACGGLDAKTCVQERRKAGYL